MKVNVRKLEKRTLVIPRDEVARRLGIPEGFVLTHIEKKNGHPEYTIECQRDTEVTEEL